MVGCPGRDAEEFTCASQSLHIQAVILLFGTKWESFSKIMPPPGLLRFLTLSLVPGPLFFFGNMDSVRFRDKCLTDLFTPFHILHTQHLSLHSAELIVVQLLLLRPNQFVRLSRPNLSAFSQQGAKRFSPFLPCANALRRPHFYLKTNEVENYCARDTLQYQCLSCPSKLSGSKYF